MIDEFKTGLSNYYGEVSFRRVENRDKSGFLYYMSLENWDGPQKIEISETLFYAAANFFVYDNDLKGKS